MADSEDLKLLKSGELDLSRCDFREADLGGMDLRGRNFSYCLFGKAKCESTNFEGSDFRNSQISFVKARNAIFNGCDLTRLHFGYVDFSGASFKNAKANGAIFQHAMLRGANLEGASLTGGSVDADTDLEGVQVDGRTDFDGLKVLRPTSRNTLFQGYTFNNGILKRQDSSVATETAEQTTKDEPAEEIPVPERANTSVTTAQIQRLFQNATLTRLTAQQFAGQIEEALRDTPAEHGNRLPEPLQTMLEFAEVLRNLAPSTSSEAEPLNRRELEERILELEILIDKLSEQLSGERKAREAAEVLAASNGFMANFRRSAGNAAGIATVTVATSLVTVGLPAAAVYFLGVEHPVVTTFFNAIGRLPK